MNDEDPDAITLTEKDNVATSLHTLQPGQIAYVKANTDHATVQIIAVIPPNHKFAIRDIDAGEHIIKFGEIIGVATRKIAKGSHVHTQNLTSLHGRGHGQPR